MKTHPLTVPMSDWSKAGRKITSRIRKLGEMAKAGELPSNSPHMQYYGYLFAYLMYCHGQGEFFKGMALFCALPTRERHCSLLTNETPHADVLDVIELLKQKWGVVEGR